MAEATAMPSREEAQRWVGADVADLDGARVGEVQGLFLDDASGQPAWLIVQIGRWRKTRLVAVPLRACAGAAFGVWVAIAANDLRTAPTVDPARPLRREHELAICAHYGIGEAIGRAAEVAGRRAGEATAAPVAA